MATKGKSKSKMKKAPAKAKSKAKAKTPAKVKIKTKAKAVVKAKPSGVAKKAASQPAKTIAVSLTSVITPLEDRVIVAVAPAETKTAGGLFIPGNVTENPDRGRVVAAGPGRRNKKGRLRPLDVKAGDDVLFAQYSGTKIQVGSSEFLILREEDVLGIVT